MKETLAGESDRKTASPTESAVSGNRRRERSGADRLNGGTGGGPVDGGAAGESTARAVREHALSVREE